MSRHSGANTAMLLLAAFVVAAMAVAVSGSELSLHSGAMVGEATPHLLAGSYWAPPQALTAGEDDFGLHVRHEVTPLPDGTVARSFELVAMAPGKEGETLLRYNVDPRQTRWRHHFTVLNDEFEYEDKALNDLSMSNTDDKSLDTDMVQHAAQESSQFEALLQRREMALLPLMSQEFAQQHGWTANKHPLSMPMHTLALHVGKIHGMRDIALFGRLGKAAKAKAELTLGGNQTIWGRLQGCMRKQNMCGKFTCGEGKCGKDCKARQLTPTECSSGQCQGMCGPSGCDCCWDWICGDCCWHQGCSNMREMCQGKAAALFSCWTAKGIMWGRNVDTFQACGGGVVPPFEAEHRKLKTDTFHAESSTTTTTTTTTTISHSGGVCPEGFHHAANGDCMKVGKTVSVESTNTTTGPLAGEEACPKGQVWAPIIKSCVPIWSGDKTKECAPGLVMRDGVCNKLVKHVTIKNHQGECPQGFTRQSDHCVSSGVTVVANDKVENHETTHHFVANITHASECATCLADKVPSLCAAVCHRKKISSEPVVPTLPMPTPIHGQRVHTHVHQHQYQQAMHLAIPESDANDARDQSQRTRDAIRKAAKGIMQESDQSTAIRRQAMKAVREIRDNQETELDDLSEMGKEVSDLEKRDETRTTRKEIRRETARDKALNQEVEKTAHRNEERDEFKEMREKTRAEGERTLEQIYHREDVNREKNEVKRASEHESMLMRRQEEQKRFDRFGREIRRDGKKGITVEKGVKSVEERIAAASKDKMFSLNLKQAGEEFAKQSANSKAIDKGIRTVKKDLSKVTSKGKKAESKAKKMISKTMDKQSKRARLRKANSAMLKVMSAVHLKNKKKKEAKKLTEVVDQGVKETQKVVQKAETKARAKIAEVRAAQDPSTLIKHEIKKVGEKVVEHIEEKGRKVVDKLVNKAIESKTGQKIIKTVNKVQEKAAKIHSKVEKGFKKAKKVVNVLDGIFNGGKAGKLSKKVNKIGGKLTKFTGKVSKKINKVKGKLDKFLGKFDKDEDKREQTGGINDEQQQQGGEGGAGQEGGDASKKLYDFDGVSPVLKTLHKRVSRLEQSASKRVNKVEDSAMKKSDTLESELWTSAKTAEARAKCAQEKQAEKKAALTKQLTDAITGRLEKAASKVADKAKKFINGKLEQAESAAAGGIETAKKAATKLAAHKKERQDVAKKEVQQEIAHDKLVEKIRKQEEEEARKKAEEQKKITIKVPTPNGGGGGGGGSGSGSGGGGGGGSSSNSIAVPATPVPPKPLVKGAQKTCRITGDPHVLGFNGRRFDIYERKLWMYYNDAEAKERIDCMAAPYQGRWANRALNRAVAIRMGGTTISYHIQGASTGVLKVNGQQARRENKEFPECTLSINGKSIKVVSKRSGMSIDVLDHSLPYLDVIITSFRTAQSQGMCNGQKTPGENVVGIANAATETTTEEDLAEGNSVWGGVTYSTEGLDSAKKQCANVDPLTRSFCITDTLAFPGGGAAYGYERDDQQYAEMKKVCGIGMYWNWSKNRCEVAPVLKKLGKVVKGWFNAGHKRALPGPINTVNRPEMFAHQSERKKQRNQWRVASSNAPVDRPNWNDVRRDAARAGHDRAGQWTVPQNKKAARTWEQQRAQHETERNANFRGTVVRSERRNEGHQVPFPGDAKAAQSPCARFGGYSGSEASSYAQKHCSDGQNSCALFASRAIAAGGEHNPSITDVAELKDWLHHNNWRVTGDKCCGPPGAIVTYDNRHAAVSIGGGLICQHSPARCGTSGDFGGAGREVWVKQAIRGHEEACAAEEQDEAQATEEDAEEADNADDTVESHETDEAEPDVEGDDEESEEVPQDESVAQPEDAQESDLEEDDEDSEGYGGDADTVEESGQHDQPEEEEDGNF